MTRVVAFLVGAGGHCRRAERFINVLGKCLCLHIADDFVAVALLAIRAEEYNRGRTEYAEAIEASTVMLIPGDEIQRLLQCYPNEPSMIQMAGKRRFEDVGAGFRLTCRLFFLRVLMVYSAHDPINSDGFVSNLCLLKRHR